MKTKLTPSVCGLILAALCSNPGSAAVPDAPQNVQPSWLWSWASPSGNEALLWWDPVPGAATYNVYWFDESNSVWNAVATGLMEPRYRNLWPPAPPARYVVTAANGEGESAPSVEAILAGGEVGFSVWVNWPGYGWPGSVTATNAWLSWSVSHVSGADGLVELGTNAVDYTMVMQNTNYQLWHNVWMTNLTPRTIYWYRLTSVGTNRAGLSVTNWFATEDTNHPPVANAVSVSTYQSYPVYITVSGTDNASYVPDYIESFRIVQGPTNGTLSATTFWAWNNTGDVLYTPSANRSFEDHFWYVANDGDLDSAPALVTITNHYVNQYPQTGYAAYSTPEGVPVAVEATGWDPDGDPVTFEWDTNTPPVGTMSGPWTNLVYTPAPGFVGTDTVLYWVSDGSLLALGVIVVDVLSTNIAPTAQAQALTVPEDSTLNVTLAGQDANGDPLTFRITTTPVHGTLNGTPPSLQYQPNANFHGADQFSFVANDGRADSDPAVISLTVTPVNDAPMVADQSVTIDEDSPLVLGFLTGSDADGDTLTFRVIGGPPHGQIVSNGTVYVPELDYAGVDTLTFVANDGQIDSAPATLIISLSNVNDPPVPNTPEASTLEDTPTTIALTAYNPDTDPLTFVLAGDSSLGTATINGVTATFTPSPNQSGPGFFDYAVSDGVYWATGRVVVQIASVEDAPVALGQSVSTSEDTAVAITLAGVDGDLDPSTFAVVTGPANGSLSGTGVDLIYTPNPNFNGIDSFTFKVNDGKADSAPATVSLTISAVNDAPIAHAQAVTTAYNTAVNLTLTGSDVDGNPLTFTVLSSPANGTLSGSAPNLTFTPNLNWAGSTSFTFRVNDGSVNSAAATVTLTVNAPTSPPAAPSALTATAVSNSRIDLAWNDHANTETGFKIERSANGSSWTQIATVGPNVRNYSATGLSANKTYYFRVRAYNTLGNSAYSNTASAKTLR